MARKIRLTNRSTSPSASDSDSLSRTGQEGAAEEEYDENADEDFNPDEGAISGVEDASSSSDEGEGKEDNTGATAKSTKKQSTKFAKGRGKGRGKGKVQFEDDLDSGDEATIRERRRSKRRGSDASSAAGDGGGGEDSDGGEGGLIRTRAQRLAEKAEKKQRKWRVDGDSTVDVNRLWAELSSIPLGRSSITELESAQKAKEQEADKENLPLSAAATGEDEMITITKQIEYAGEVTTITDRVPRTSKEGQKWLAEHPSSLDSQESSSRNPNTKTLHRPLKRPSQFEPNPTAAIKGIPPQKLRPRAPNRLDVLLASKREAEEARKKAQRMTTVQKSALDWRGFVEQQEGLRHELDEYGRSKKGFLAREAFLDRAQGARDDAAREARLKG